MNVSLYRIFDALGDSIILASYFKHYSIKTVYYNRGDFNTLLKILEIAKVEVPEFVHINGRITETMPDLLHQMRIDKAPLISITNRSKAEHSTFQFKTNSNNAEDRSMNLEEIEEQLPKLNNPKDTLECTDLDSLVRLMKKSERHITIDSGTAWLAAALKVPTTVISKNSYYFADAYHYMRYLQTQPGVTIYQQTGKGVKVATEEQYHQYAKENKVNVPPYNDYQKKALKI